MKKNLIVYFVTFLTLQVNAAAPENQINESPQIEQMSLKLKRAHNELRTLRAQLSAILTIVLEELEDFELTRSIDFNAYNNLQDEYDKYQNATEEDAEEVEGDQE